jgi:hypothetical protein
VAGRWSRLIPSGKSTSAGSVNVVMAPAVVMRPIRPLAKLVNQSAPSGPVVMSSGWETCAAGSVNVVMSPTAANALLAPTMITAATNATATRVARVRIGRPLSRRRSQCVTMQPCGSG